MKIWHAGDPPTPHAICDTSRVLGLGE